MLLRLKVGKPHLLGSSTTNIGHHQVALVHLNTKDTICQFDLRKQKIKNLQPAGQGDSSPCNTCGGKRIMKIQIQTPVEKEQ